MNLHQEIWYYSNRFACLCYLVFPPEVLKFVLFCFRFYLSVCFFVQNRGSLCNLCCLTASSFHKIGFELTEIHLLLLPESGIKAMYHCCPTTLVAFSTISFFCIFIDLIDYSCLFDFLYASYILIGISFIRLRKFSSLISLKISSVPLT